MAKANQKKTQGKRNERGGAKRGSKTATSRSAGRSTSGAKRSAKDRLATAPSGRSRHGEEFPERKRKSMVAHRREKTTETGEVVPASA